MAPDRDHDGTDAGAVPGDSSPGPVARRLEDKLRAAFAPARLVLVDESRHHAGHAAATPGGETHFRLEIVARAFAGKSRLERSRMIHRVLSEELAGPVHALAITARAPGEGPGDRAAAGAPSGGRAD